MKTEDVFDTKVGILRELFGIMGTWHKFLSEFVPLIQF